MNHLVWFRYLIALDEHKHFSRAADACNITQPALSNALKALEESYGISIISRGRSFIGFTDEGQKVLASARRIMREHETLQQEIHGGSSEPTGQLTIGAIPTAMPIASRFAAFIQAKHTAVSIDVKSLSSQDLEASVENGSLDMALGYAKRLSSRHSHLTVMHQYDEQYYFVQKYQPSERVNGQKGSPIAWANAANHPLCLLSKAMHNRHIIDQTFKDVGATPHVVIETNSIATLGIVVMAGHVATIMPGALVYQMRAEPDMEIHPLISPEINTDISWILLKTERQSHVLSAALAFAQSPEWALLLQQHAGALSA